MSLKAICSDNGGEYTCMFDEYCRKHEIKHERTISKTLQQNELVKRMNYTIYEKVWSILSHAKLLKIF